MSGFVKLMSNEVTDDSDSSKSFKLFSLCDGGTVEFKKNDSGFDTLIIHNSGLFDPEEHLMRGNAYVLSNTGKTIASHSTNVESVTLGDLLSNQALAAQLALLDFGDVKAVLKQAAELNKQTNSRFIAAVGDFLATLVNDGDVEADLAVKHAASYLPDLGR